MNFFNIGPMELLLILTVILIVFGPDKIPDIAGSIGKSLRKFRDASKELSDEFDLEDLNPSTIADALEARAASEEKSDGEPPALPAGDTAAADNGDAESNAATRAAAPSPKKDAPADASMSQRFHLPPAEPQADASAAAPTPVKDAPADASAPRRFHLPPAEPAPAADPPLTDYASPEDED